MTSRSANEIGPFRAVEESIIAQLIPQSDRSDVYSWYSLIGIVGQALGTLTCGQLTQYLESKKHWSRTEAYRVIFFGYAVLGLLKLVLTVILSPACEINENEATKPPLAREASEARESSPLLEVNLGPQGTKSRRHRLSPSKDSLVALTEVCCLQFLEAISIGLIVT